MLRRGMMAGAAAVDATALSIYNKLALGDWFTCESATSPLVGAHNSTSAAKIGTGATSVVTGKVGDAIDTTPNALYQSTTLPFTPATGSTYAIGGWVYADGINAVSPFVLGQHDNQNGTDRALQLFFLSTGAALARAGNDVGSFTDAATATSTVTTGAWYFFQGERGTNYVRVRINNGSWVSASLTVNQAPVTNQRFRLGGDFNSSTTTHLNQFDGKYDEAFFLQGTLTDTEWDYLYNAGAGISYAALKAAAGY